MRNLGNQNSQNFEEEKTAVKPNFRLKGEK